jgi:hypothetical protein
MNRNELIKSLNLKGIGLEVGVYQGDFSNVLLGFTNLHLYLLDAWRHFPTGYADSCNASDELQILRMATTVAKLRKYEGRFTLIRDLSVSAAEMFKDEFFDFIYLDANHSYQGISEDLNAWYPKLKKGGIFSGHDYVDKPPYMEVKKAVDEFAQKYNYTVSTTTSDGPYLTWYLTK